MCSVASFLKQGESHRASSVACKSSLASSRASCGTVGGLPSVSALGALDEFPIVCPACAGEQEREARSDREKRSDGAPPRPPWAAALKANQPCSRCRKCASLWKCDQPQQQEQPEVPRRSSLSVPAPRHELRVSSARLSTQQSPAAALQLPYSQGAKPMQRDVEGEMHKLEHGELHHAPKLLQLPLPPPETQGATSDLQELPAEKAATPALARSGGGSGGAPLGGTPRGVGRQRATAGWVSQQQRATDLMARMAEHHKEFSEQAPELRPDCMGEEQAVHDQFLQSELEKRLAISSEASQVEQCLGLTTEVVIEVVDKNDEATSTTAAASGLGFEDASSSSVEPTLRREGA